MNHVPDELCVDISAPRGSDPAVIYEQARVALNRHLQDETGRLTPARLQRDGLSESLARDVEPRGVRGLRGEVLRSLVRRGLGVDARSATVQPWIVLPGNDQHDNFHLYFQVGAERVSFRADALNQRHQRERRVRELTNLLNLGALGMVGSASGPDWSVAGSQANWLKSGLPFSCGSPAALPLAEQSTTGLGPFRFGEAVNAALAEKGSRRRAKVIVAVLDTCPDPARLDDRGNPRLGGALAVAADPGLGLGGGAAGRLLRRSSHCRVLECLPAVVAGGHAQRRHARADVRHA